jgi:TonB family protein
MPSPSTPAKGSSSAKGDTPRLVLTHFVQPVYPLEAMNQKLQGHVVIHLVISATGEVPSADPVSGNPIFTQAAVAAMKQWKFQPYRHNGQAVQIGYKMPYDFAMATQVRDRPDPDANATASDAKPPAAASASAAAVPNEGEAGLHQGTAPEVSPTPNSSSAATARPIQINGGQAQQLILHQVGPVYPDLVLKFVNTMTYN